MTRPSWERGRRRHTNMVQSFARTLVGLRATLDGMSGNDPEFSDTLDAAATAAADLSGAALRMDRDGDSRRTACARLVLRNTAQIMEL